MIFSTIGAGPVIHPSLAPGATIFENESTRMTRPSISSERKVGTMGLSAPLGRICKKQSFVSSASCYTEYGTHKGRPRR